MQTKFSFNLKESPDVLRKWQWLRFVLTHFLYVLLSRKCYKCTTIQKIAAQKLCKFIDLKYSNILHVYYTKKYSIYTRFIFFGKYFKL